jgi:hypothetical protein
MMKKSLWTGALLFVCLVVPGMVMAQPTVNLDWDAAQAGIQNAITVSKSASLADRTIVANLVAAGAVDLTGVSVDIGFDAATALTLQSIKEVPGDANFDGSLDLTNEVLPAINQFVGEFNFDPTATPENFRDGYTRNSYVIFDTDGSNTLELTEEVLPVIDEFVLEFNFDPQAEIYWTRQVIGYDPQFDESVEVFDAPAKSNVGGANVGLIDDITAVLLKRPGRAGDFGFDGDAIIATLKFVVRSDAQTGEHQFTFPQAVYIDKTFTGDLATQVKIMLVPGVLPKVTVTE